MLADLLRRSIPSMMAALSGVVLAGSLVLAQGAAPSASPTGPAPEGEVTGAPGAVAGASFLPAGTVAYLELRGDLPAGQGDALIKALVRFPGFAGTSDIESAADAALEAWLTDATRGAFSWISDVRPWFGGRISFGLFDYISVAREDPAFLLGLEVTDPVRARELADRVADLAGGDVPDALNEQTYAGVAVVSDSDGRWAYAVGENVLLVGSGVDEVLIGLDVLSGAVPSLASSDAFEAAFARLPEGRLAAGYADLDALRRVLLAVLARDPIPSGDLWMGVLEMLPPDVTFYLAARPDGALLEAYFTYEPGAPGVAAGEPTLATSFPADTQLLVEAPAVGANNASAWRWFARLVDGPSSEAIEVFGSSVEKLVGWMGDAALGAGTDGSRAWFGLVIAGANDGAADVYVGLVQAALAAAVLQARSDPWDPEPPLSVSVSDVNGAEVTTMTFTSRAMSDRLPFEPSLAIAQDGERLLIGTSGFVERSLGLEPESSLASDRRYRDALAEAGSPNLGHAYVDVSALRQALEPLVAISTPWYEDVAPYLVPFDRAVFGWRVTQEGVRVTSIRILLD